VNLIKRLNILHGRMAIKVINVLRHFLSFAESSQEKPTTWLF